jgi:hypothetical protein
MDSRCNGTTISTSGNSLTLGCNPSASAIDLALGTATATDACGTPTVTASTGAVSGACSKSQTRTFTAIDACGNSSTASRTATWTDDPTPPTITCPAAQPFCQVAGNNYTIPAATATDNCAGAITFSYVKSGANTGSGSGANASGVYTNAGVTTVIFTATDACGNSSTCSTTVTITVTPTASISYPGTPFCSGQTTASVNLTGTGAYTVGTFSALPAGLTFDASGNITASSAGSYTVTYTIPAAGGCAQVVANTTVGFGTPPVMTIQPPLDTGVCKDNDITLISAATGAPTPTVQWQIMPKNSSTWSDIAGPIGTNPNLTLTSVGQNDNGNRYRVIYTNFCGSVYFNCDIT